MVLKKLGKIDIPLVILSAISCSFVAIKFHYDRINSTVFKEVYRMVPVHPDDQHLLGMLWDSFLYVDKVLPFGLRSAPKIFSAVADALQWILHKEGIHLGLHYLDDFILVASEHGAALSQKDSIFSRLGVLLEESKLEGPSSCLTFLSIEVDTGTLQLSLTREKLTKLKCQLTWAICHRSVPKQDLESLTGLLQWAACLTTFFLLLPLWRNHSRDGGTVRP